MNNTISISKKFTGLGKKLYSKGQGMTEYLIILGLIAIAAITVFTLYGEVLRNQVGGMAAELAGGDGSANVTAATTAGTAAGTAGTTKKTLKDYNNTGGTR